MKRSIRLIGILLFVLLLTGCGNKNTIGGEELHFTKGFKNHYITYNYPEEFKEKENENAYNTKEYEYYKDDKLAFVLKIEEKSLLLSFKPMEEDAEKLEKDPNNKDIQSTVLKMGKKNIVRYSFRKSDDFGNDTLYYVYYAGYSYMGVSEYIKITFINVDGKEDFEKAFFNNFKIND